VASFNVFEDNPKTFAEKAKEIILIGWAKQLDPLTNIYGMIILYFIIDGYIHYNMYSFWNITDK